MKYILTASLSIIISNFSYSQSNTDSTLTSSNPNIIINKDSRIDKLNETYTASHKLNGYRVQIYRGNKKQPANQARSVFLRVHPKTKAHLKYDQPSYIVRVGDFRTKLEALKYKNKITNEFPNCFIVKDDIDISELD